MNIDPAAVLAVISEQATRISHLEAENLALRDGLAAQPQTEETPK